MKTKSILLAVLAVPAVVMATTSTSKAINVGVADCAEFAPCWSNSSPTPFNAFISLPDLNFLGEGISVFLVANQAGDVAACLGAASKAYLLPAKSMRSDHVGRVVGLP
jgi:hypothetical protein